MIMDADMGMDMTTTTTMSTSIFMLVTRIHTIIILITHTTMGLVYHTMTMPVIMWTRTQIHIPPILTNIVSTAVLIAAIAMLP